MKAEMQQIVGDLKRVNFSSFAEPEERWNNQRQHSLARHMLTFMPETLHEEFLRRGRPLGGSWFNEMREYLFINRLVLRARKFAKLYPDQKPFEPFLHWWQCGIEQLGQQFFTVSNSVQSKNYWNASNIWELCPKESRALNAHAVWLETPEQRTLLCFMLALYSPLRAKELSEQLDVDMREIRHLHPDTRRLIFNLMATFHSF